HAKAQRTQRRKEKLACLCAFAFFAPLREIKRGTSDAQSTLHNLRCWRGEPLQRRRAARLGNQRRLATAATTRCTPKRLSLVPLLALRLTRRKMMLDATIFGLFIPLENLLPVLVTTIVFVVLGLIVFALAFLVITKAAPFSVRKEIEDDQNIALA